jgi:hypothetical protein
LLFIEGAGMQAHAGPFWFFAYPGMPHVLPAAKSLQPAASLANVTGSRNQVARNINGRWDPPLGQ